MAVLKTFSGAWPDEAEINEGLDIIFAFVVVPCIIHRAPPIVTDEELRSPRSQC
jgi:hypothetical protein